MLHFVISFCASVSLLAAPPRPAADPLPSSGSMEPGVSAGVTPLATNEPIGVPPPEAFPPGVATMIEGINFDEGAANSGFYNIPPDPIGAAGPNHVVSVVNTSIEWHTKAGVQQLSQKLGTTSGGFFAPLSPANGTFDPKVIYDQIAGRFVVVTLEKVDNGLASPQPANTSRILIAVSDDSDPNGTWRYFAINAKTTTSGIERWADYPGLAVDEDAIYITNNLFSFAGNGGGYGGTRLWIVNKTPLYAGGAGTFTVHDPYAGGGSATTAQPAHIYGTPPAGATGTFLVSYSGLSDGTNEYLQVVRVDNPLTAPTFSQQYINIGNIDTAAAFPNAPQSGTASLVWTNDSRALNAVWRNNRLYTTASTLPPSGVNAGQVTARFWELNTTTLAAMTQVQSGEIGGEEIAAGAYTFFPSIAVNAAGDICIGFSASAPTIFAGAYAAVRLAGDTLGTVRPALTVAAGTDFYLRTFGGARNRWGDYSGTSVDPANDSDFWIFNEYAMTRGTVFSGEDGRWATRWAKIDVATQPPTLTAPATASTHSTSVPVNFNLPETALAGSVTLAFTGPATRTLTLAASQETSGAHSFSVNPASPVGGAVASISGGATIPNGTYTVTLSYSDTFSNVPATAATANVTIDTTTQTPTLTAPATNATVGNPVGVSLSLPETALAGSVQLIFSGAASRTLTLAATEESSGAHSFSFNPANPTLAPQIASITGGASIPDGVYTITLSYRDALGNAAATAASTNVTLSTNTPPTGGNFTVTPNTGVHEGDPLTLTAAGWTDPNTPLTYQFFLGLASLNSPSASSTLGISAPPPGSYTLKVRVTDSLGAFTDAIQPLTVVAFTSAETWRQFYFDDYHNTGNGADSFDFDSDTLINGIEFAFGTDPTNNLSGPAFLQYTGTFSGGGAVAAKGQPVPGFESIVNGIDFRLLFNRRVNHVADGVTYIPEFSADMTPGSWVPGGTTPSVLATDGTIQVVSVPYLRFIGGKKARFARVRVIIAP